jgi:tetratricopeptide (TPR) repeat protein
MLELASEVGDPALYLVAHAFIANVGFWQGDFTRSRIDLAQALKTYDPAQHQGLAYLYGQDMAVTANCYQMLNEWYLGDTAAADHADIAALRTSTEMHHPFSVCWAHNFAMTMRSLNHEYEAVIKRADELIAISMEQAYPFWIPAALTEKGWAMAMLGDPAAGLPLIEQGIAGWELIGTIVVAPLFHGWHAEALRLNGQETEAMTSVELGISKATKNGEIASEIDLHQIKGELLAQMNRRNEAEQSIRHAIELARPRSAISRELQACVSLYTLLRGTPGESQARADALAVLAKFPASADKPFLAHARRTLEAA